MATQKLNIFPNDREGQFALIGTTLPVGATVDNIFYIQDGANYYKRIIDGRIRASHCGIFADGIDRTSRLNAALAHTGIKELVLDHTDGIVTINGTINVPLGKKLIVEKNCMIGGTGSLSVNGELIADDDRQIFSNTFVVTNLYKASTAWWGAKRNYSNDAIAKNAFQSAINSGAIYIKVPSTKTLGSSYYYMSDTLDISRDIIIEGDGSTHNPQVTLIWPPNTTCIRLRGSSRIHLKDIRILQEVPGSSLETAVWDTTKHGIDTTTFVYLRNVHFEQIAGNGLHIDAQVGVGNADQSKVVNCYFTNCANGVYATGGDANIISFYDNDYTSNRRWGYYSDALLGCIHFNSHFSDNGKTAETLTNYAGITYAAINQIGVTNINHRPDLSPLYWRVMPFVFPSFGVWSSTKEYFSGGTYAAVNINAKEKFYGAYSESSEPGYILAARSVTRDEFSEAGGSIGPSQGMYEGVMITNGSSQTTGDETVGGFVRANIYDARAGGGYFIQLPTWSLYGTGLAGFDDQLQFWYHDEVRAFFDTDNHLHLRQIPADNDNSDKVPTTSWVKGQIPNKINISYFKQALPTNIIATTNVWNDVISQALPSSGVWQLNGTVTVKQNDASNASYISYRIIDTTNNVVLASGTSSPNGLNFNTISLSNVAEATTAINLKLQVRPSDNSFVQIMAFSVDGDQNASILSGFRIGDYTP